MVKYWLLHSRNYSIDNDCSHTRTPQRCLSTDGVFSEAIIKEVRFFFPFMFLVELRDDWILTDSPSNVSFLMFRKATEWLHNVVLVTTHHSRLPKSYEMAGFWPNLVAVNLFLSNHITAKWSSIDQVSWKYVRSFSNSALVSSVWSLSSCSDPTTRDSCPATWLPITIPLSQST